MGRPKLNNKTPYQLAFEPILLKGLCVDCGISQAQIGREMGLSRPSINLTLNKGYIPRERPDFVAKVEEMIRSDKRAMQWLISRGFQLSDIWQPLGKALRNASPAADNQKMWATRRRKDIIPGDPETFIIKQEAEMENSVSQEALKYFKLFRNPFKSPDDVQKDSDIYMSEDHRYIEAAMLDAARNGGFLAVIGECGAGKSTIRKKVVGQLLKEGGCHVIFPMSNMDSVSERGPAKITPGKLIDAIIMDISDQRVDTRLEHKARQMRKLLLERSQQGYQSVMIIEEAHNLQFNAFKYLKRFYELEDGYKKLLGIILIGQPEMKNLLNEELHVDLREVIRRIQVAEIKGLNGNIKDYLTLKLKRVGAKLEDIIDDEAITALGRRLTYLDRRNKTISHAYPLTIHSYMATAMNKAYELGEPRVTESVIMAIGRSET